MLSVAVILGIFHGRRGRPWEGLGGVIQVQVSGICSSQAVMQGLRQIGERRSLRSMQSFPGSLKYYSRFIEDFKCTPQYCTNYEKLIFMKSVKRTMTREP